jgi:hypothetical protein
MFPLSERKHKLDIEKIGIQPEGPAPALEPDLQEQISNCAARIKAAREDGRPVMLTYGAHLIKNGLGPVVVRLVKDGWVTHVATNGAGTIHDWEFAYLGRSTEDVRINAAHGQFGTWEETGANLNLAVAVGGIDGLGYGWSLGKMISEDGLTIPSAADLRDRIAREAARSEPNETLGALADLLHLVTTFGIPAGRIDIRHPFKKVSVQCAAYEKGIPFTVHPGIGYDIIYTHPMNCGGAIGRGAVADFLSYADSVASLEGGVHIAVGSAIMAPMIFEKALSMANNLALVEGRPPLSKHYMVVVDIQDGGGWNWNDGEPPMDNPAYYLRFCKSFYRMGGTLDYVCLDNRDFMVGLYHALQ